MDVKFKKTFIKDLNHLPQKIKRKVQDFVFVEIVNADSIHSLPQVKKIKGYENYFRQRIGDYRIGFEMKKDYVLFYRVLHRKDIYKRFP